MSEEDKNQPHARVTLQMLYNKQLGNERLLIELHARLVALENIPARVTQLEIQNAKNEWIGRIAYSALAAGIAASIVIFFQLIGN